MVGVNSYIHRFGTVAIFATLFAAIHVNGERGCVLDSEHAADFDLECNDATKDSWKLNEDKESPNKKVLILTPGKEGCVKIKRPVNLNSTYPIALRFFQEPEKDENVKVTMRLIPKEGDCPDQECVWNVGSETQVKPGKWITVEHKFPLKSMREYFVQLQVDNTKGKFLLDRFVLPSFEAGKCHEISGKEVKDETRINLPDPLVGVAGNGTTSDCNLVELSKNLMLTSASVLTLNNLFN